MYYEMLYDSIKRIDCFVDVFVGTLFVGENYHKRRMYEKIIKDSKLQSLKLNPSHLEYVLNPCMHTNHSEKK